MTPVRATSCRTLRRVRSDSNAVNMVTPALFARYRTAEDYAGADIAELEELIRSTGFFRNKAKSLRGMARMVVDEYGDFDCVDCHGEDLVEVPSNRPVGTWRWN